MKIFIVLALVAVAACDKFDKAEIDKAQKELIGKTIAQLKEWAGNKLTAVYHMEKCVNDKLEIMDKNMMEEAKKRKDEGLTIISDIFTDVHKNVYEDGRSKALKGDLVSYTMKNKTDGMGGLAKFCATSVVIEWRTSLDKERRTVHPTTCPKDEQTAQAQWKVETDKVQNVLKKLIPELQDAKSAYWAYLHQKMLTYIEMGIPIVNQKIREEKDMDKKIKTLCLLTEDLNLLNTVAASR